MRGRCSSSNRHRWPPERVREVHSNLSINVLSLFPAAFDRQVDIVARLGARSISPDLGQLDDLSSAQTARLIHDAGLKAAALTHRAFGFANAAEAQERLARSIDLAKGIGAASIVLTTGGRGALNWSDAAQRFAEAIAPCSALARRAGIRLGIEPTSHLYADASIAHRLSDCVALAQAADISVVVDLFACWTDVDIQAAIAQAGPRIALVQVSDYVYGDRGLPCRAVPGDGAIPLGKLLGAIMKSGFEGTYDLEIIGPRLATEGIEKGLIRAAQHVGNLLDGQNG